MAAENGRTRRQFFKDAGGLLIGFSLVDAATLPRLMGAVTPDSATTPAPNQLESWLRIEQDGTVQIFTGKAEIGMGVETAFGQIIAEELDVPFERVSFLMGDTAMTTNQGGVGGSTSIQEGGKPLRNVAASARYLLVQMASEHLGVPMDGLQVKDGVVSVKGDESRHVSYAELVGGKELNDALKVSGEGFAVNVQGPGKPKDPANYTVVGKPIPRVDLPPKLLGQFQYIVDVKVPGMLHGRPIRPAGVGATLVKVDEEPAKVIPGYVKTVVKGNFIGVVAETEWAAIRVSKALKVTWSDPQQAFPEQTELYRYMRSASPKASKTTVNRGDANAAISGAAKKVEASYNWPFQSHATMGPGCAVADVRIDGVTTVWSGGQKPHDLQKGVAELLGIALDKVRIIWVEDAGSYGRPGYEDAAADAVLLSQVVGKPVRVQWMRADMTQWGSKGPAVVYDLAGGLDAHGEITGFRYTSRAFSGGETMYHPDSAGNFLAGQLTGIPNTTGMDEFAQYGAHSAAYEFGNVHADAYIVPAFYPSASPLRTTHLRDPEGPSTTFAVESFMDELAAAAGADPIEFRLKYLKDPRSIALLTAVSDHSKWNPRPSPNTAAHADDTATGRGVAFATRGGTYIATIAEVEVNRRTGALLVKRIICGHDCGLIVNPDGLRGVIAANVVQSLSRSLKEEVLFSRTNVTSVDWKTYPVARAEDIPEIEIVPLNHPEAPPTGAGEPSSRTTAAAIANAIFDATGARVREAPMTRARIKAAITASATASPVTT